MQQPRKTFLRKLPPKYAAVMMPFVLSIIMTCIISGVSTIKSLGFSAAALATWPSAWGISWLIAFPTLLVVLPIVRRIVSLLVEAPDKT